MKTSDIEALRRAIGDLEGDSRQREQKELNSLVASLKPDLLAASERGVTWKAMAEAVSEKTGLRISAERLRKRAKPSALETGPQPPAPAAAREKPPRRNSGHFIAAAVTPHGGLYQLEHSGKVSGTRGGVYSTYEVDAQGNMHVRKGPDFPCPSGDRKEAIGRFKEWCAERGYEILGGQ